MYVCICNAVTENDIAEAVIDGASSVSCLKQRLAVSTCCGQCEERASDCLEKILLNQNVALSAALPTLHV